MNTAAATITPETTVGEVMTTDLVTLKLDDTLRLADDLMNLTRVSHFPVLDGEVKVQDVMKPATTISPDTSVHEGARIMVERGIECLLVLDGDKLVGLVSRTDLLRELAKK